MKKIFSLVLVLLLALLLCGCNLRQTISRSGTEYIVSAIGFDQSGDRLSVIMEAVVTNTEDSDSGNQTKLLKGTGINIDTAFSDALKYATEPLYLSHLGVAVMGESLSSENFKNICDWFYNKQDTTLSTFFITAENSQELLSAKPVSSVAVGYDLVGLLEQSENETGAKYQNRFYKIESIRLEEYNTFALPCFTVLDEEIFLDGVTIFKNCISEIMLTQTETLYYHIACDKQKSGTVILNGKALKLNSAQTKYSLNGDNNSTVTLNVSLKSERNTIPKDEIEKGITELFARGKDRNIDIFNLTRIIRLRDSEIWTKLNSNFDTEFKNFSIEVNVND